MRYRHTEQRDQIRRNYPHPSPHQKYAKIFDRTADDLREYLRRQHEPAQHEEDFNRRDGEDVGHRRVRRIQRQIVRDRHRKRREPT